MKDICRTGMPDWKEGMAMSFIEVEHVNKTFRINKRSKGLAGMAANLVRPRYEYRRAVSDMNFTINEGEMVGFIGPNVPRYEQETGSLFRHLQLWRELYT